MKLIIKFWQFYNKLFNPMYEHEQRINSYRSPELIRIEENAQIIEESGIQDKLAFNNRVSKISEKRKPIASNAIFVEDFFDFHVDNNPYFVAKQMQGEEQQHESN